ncbi:serine protease hepsin [Lingula anatina]|uniref:Serine protease hepsin n=1 Tax=Lingula anatina TaxID=7574 RepID=A0A1S3HR79_LINAN|nr:serine protease hepsin [Lingula anatina]|eukprot:XP_013387554.1 serine protease hepsin [Lingula anatina]
MLTLTVLVLLAVTATPGDACGGTMTATSEGQEFNSTNYPYDYSNNENCEWIFNAGPDGWLYLGFATFDIEDHSSCNYDYVKVFDGDTELGKFCGNTRPADFIRNTASLRVEFRTDSSIAKGGFRAGFVMGPAPTTTPAPATTTTTPSPNGCGGTLTATATVGIFQSPDYPSNYPHSQNCEWTISTELDDPITLTFDVFSLESHSSCNYDAVEIFEVSGGQETSKGKYCGTNRPDEIILYDGSFKVVFTSDSSVSNTGFSASFVSRPITCESRGGSCVASLADCESGRVNDLASCPQSADVCCLPSISPSNCGRLPASTRIVGGDDSEEHAWPWQVSLQTTSSSFHFCGGSLINAQWVITAAHCVEGEQTSAFKVVLGEHHREQTSGNEVERGVARFIMHPQYDGSGAGFPNDIALVKLASPVSLDGPHMRAACLPEPGEEYSASDECWITGWGDTKGTGNEQILQELRVDIRDRETCRSNWGSGYIRDTHVCINDGTTGACNGDSGGPLVCLARSGSGLWNLVGATSWGRTGCQTAGYPSVYTRVSEFRDWIEEQILADN